MSQQVRYVQLVEDIRQLLQQNRQKVVRVVNTTVISTYRKVGEHIVEFEQNRNERAKYGSGLLERLSKDLTMIHGKGFSLSNVKRMRQFYNEYSIGATVSHQLSWSHYVELLKIEDKILTTCFSK